MAEPKDLIISEFNKGIAASPHVGFQDIHALDIYSSPGIVQPNYRTSKVSSTTVTDLIKWVVQDPTTLNYYALGNAGKVYKSTDAGSTWALITGNTTTNAHGNGLVVWKGHLLVFRDSFIDVMRISDETWTNSWAGLNTDVDFHPAIVGQDDVVYYGNANYVGSITEATAPFAPGTGASYTINGSALDIPSQYRIKCLAQLGNYLLLGTIVGTNSYGNLNVADIFPWDISRGLSSFSTPIKLNERGVHQMITVSNRTYIVAGSNPKVFVTDGVNVAPPKKIPDSVTNMDMNGGAFLTMYPGAIANHNGRIMFGVSSGTLTGVAPKITGLGVYGLSTDGVLTYEHQISTGAVDATNNLLIGSLFSNGTSLIIGWRDDATYGIDQVSSSSKYTSYESYLISPFYLIASPLTKKKLSQYDIILAKPLVNSNDGVRISYRANLSNSFTVIDTLDFDTYGAWQALNRAFTKGEMATIQIKVELKGSAQLKELRFR